MQSISMGGIGSNKMPGIVVSQALCFSKLLQLILLVIAGDRIIHSPELDKIEVGGKSRAMGMPAQSRVKRTSYGSRPFLALANRLKNEYLNLRKRCVGASSILTAKDAWVVRLKRSR